MNKLGAQDPPGKAHPGAPQPLAFSHFPGQDKSQNLP